MPDSTTVFVSKERFKFSSAHMTVFPDGTKEALHGHNFQVSLSTQVPDTAFSRMIDFSVFKKVLQRLCAQCDERVIIATQNPFFEGCEVEGQYEMTLCGKRYVFPRDEVALLDVDNITTEALSKLLLHQFLDALRVMGLLDRVDQVELRVDETRGQGAASTYRREK